MIEKILARLEELKNYDCGGMRCTDCPYTDLCFEGEEKEKVLIDKCKEIVQEVAKDSGWIPVESELPKKHGKYLVTVENLTGRDVLPEKVFECAYAFGKFIFNGSYDNRVTAWRKKPAPYQKGEPHE